jgi:thioredoxin 1
MGLTTRVVRGDKAERLLLLMHGIGSNEHDLAGLAPIIDPDGNFVTVCPRGPYGYGPGFAWFRMESPELVGPTMDSSLQALDDVVESACAEYGLSREQMVVGGFSMGGAMSLMYTFRHSDRPRPAGVLVMSGFLPGDPETLDWTTTDERGLPPVLMQHGIHDPMVPLERAKYTVRILEEHNVSVQFREYAMDHTVTPDSATDAKEWLEQVHRGEKPAAVHTEVSVPVEAEDDDALVRSVNSTNFDRIVLQNPKPVIVDFWAPWCGPCRAVAPVVEQIAAMRKGNYVVVKCNIDESPDIAQKYNVQSIPLIGLFRNGRLERTSLGAKPRPQLEAELGMLVIP